MKLNELNRAELDYWVATAEGHDASVVGTRCIVHTRSDGFKMGDKADLSGMAFHASTEWRVGGPLIEREKLMIQPKLERDGDFYGTWRCVALSFEGRRHADAEGETPLIAAMRGYLISRYGYEFDFTRATAIRGEGKEGGT
jgi:hypothetical protein